MNETTSPPEFGLHKCSHEPLSVGDHVHVKSYGRAVVITALQTDESNRFHQRIQIQYPDGKRYWARPSVLRKIAMPSERIITTETTRQYREAALRYVNPEDTCLEVGCHEGVTSALLHDRCHFIVGVDLSEKTINAAKAKYPRVQFQTVDGHDIKTLSSLSPTGHFDKILLDIGGIAELPAVMGLIGLYYRTWKKSIIIVKSVFFGRLIEDTAVYQPSAACLSSNTAEAIAQKQHLREAARQQL